MFLYVFMCVLCVYVCLCVFMCVLCCVVCLCVFMCVLCVGGKHNGLENHGKDCYVSSPKRREGDHVGCCSCVCCFVVLLFCCLGGWYGGLVWGVGEINVEFGF